jgi:hypothetical protein
MRVVNFPEIIFILLLELYHTGGTVFFSVEFPAGTNEMITKVDDRNVTI